MKRKVIVPLVFFGMLFLGAIIHYFLQPKTMPAYKAKDYNCILEYGRWQCINDSVVIPFYNASSQPVTFVSVTVPVKNGYNIYNVSEPLEAYKTASLTTASCSALAEGSFTLKWCCSRYCFETEMNAPNEKIEIVREKK